VLIAIVLKKQQHFLNPASKRNQYGFTRKKYMECVVKCASWIYGGCFKSALASNLASLYIILLVIGRYSNVIQINLQIYLCTVLQSWPVLPCLNYGGLRDATVCCKLETKMIYCVIQKVPYRKTLIPHLDVRGNMLQQKLSINAVTNTKFCYNYKCNYIQYYYH
jgi:hypothetical protein